jgi:steroid 5-alpha reductase family enzyme
MIAVVTILCAFALGFFMRTRLAANATYAVAYLWAFTFQTLYLILDSFSGTSASPAFEPSDFPLSYGLVALAIFLVGFGLVEAGHRFASRRRARTGEVVTA